MSQAIMDAKKVKVAEIAEKIKSAQSTVVVEYRGLTVAEVTNLRRALKKENVELKVYKNSLTQRAAVDAGFPQLEECLVGPNAVAFGLDDAVAPARVLADFAKAHPALILKQGIVSGEIVDEKQLNTIATLPNKEGMLSMLLSCLQSPVRGFALAVKAVAEKEQA